MGEHADGRAGRGKLFWSAPILLLLLTLAMIAYALLRAPAAPPEKKVKLTNVSVETVVPRVYDEGLRLPARLMALSSAEVSAEFTGRLLKWRIAEGAKVSAGAPVAELDASDTLAKLAEAKASLAAAKAASAASTNSVVRARAGLDKANRDLKSLDTDLESAESARKLAKTEHDRTANLVTGGVLSRAELDRAEEQLTQAELGVAKVLDLKETAKVGVASAEAALAEAEAGVEAAAAQIEQASAAIKSLEVRLSKHTLYAPVGGVLEEHLAEPGEVVNAAQTLAVIYDLSSLKVPVMIPDRYVPFFDTENPAIRQYLAGQQNSGKPFLRTSITIPGLPKLTGGNNEGVTLPAKVGRVAAAANPTSNTFEVELLVENPGDALRQGMIGQAEVNFLRYDEAIIIPVSSVLVTDKGPRVLVVNNDDGREVTEARIIVPLSINGNDMHIQAGLAAGDRLVVGGWKGVAPGEQVNVVMEDGELVGQQ